MPNSHQLIRPGKHPYANVARAIIAIAVCCITSTAVGCASNGTGRPGAAPSSSRNDAQITGAEIESAHQPTLYDVVMALRPMWLRGATTAIARDQDAGVMVYLDEQRAGGLDVLRQLPATAAASLHFYTASEAQSRFGLGNLRGVIQITSARGARGSGR